MENTGCVCSVRLLATESETATQIYDLDSQQ